MKLPSPCCPPDARVDLSLYLGLQVERIICHPQGSSCESSSIFFPLLEDPPSQRTQITHKHTHQGPCHRLYLNQEREETRKQHKAGESIYSFCFVLVLMRNGR